MVEPVGFIEAWKAQFPESEPPKMELRSVGGIEQELERCKASIRRLEQEVNKERFRMIYLQTLLAKERKSYDKQRWGFRKTPLGGYVGDRSRFHIAVSPRRPTLPPPDKELPSDPKDKMGMGLGVAALRSNFERIKRKPLPPPPPPFYPNMEFHHDRALVRVNERDVSEKIGSLGGQAMQMERKRSLHSLPGNLATVAGELRARPVYRGRSTENTCGYDAEYEDGEPNQRHTGRANGGKPPPPPWQPSEFQAYSSVYVGGVMMGEGGGGDGRGGGGVPVRDLGGGDDHLLTWPRRSYSPGSFEDVGGGGGYTPDCSSNENLTSSEEDFSSGQSSHVSPSPTTAFRRPFREKSRSPSQNSQNSQHSFDSSSPPTPQSQKRHQRQQGGRGSSGQGGVDGIK
uniref:Bcr-Abl oncoprotein oligomerisation domain-containing protein n=1 Tax=Mola mola TaxID=94237 RepID=A0A3Q3X9P8_MOLML